MMTFKEFYLQSSKGNKAPPRASRSFKTHKQAERDFGSDREAEGSRGIDLASTHKHFDDKPACPNYPLTGHMADIAKPTLMTQC